MTPGKPVLDKLDRDIAAWKARRQSRATAHYVALVLVILALCLLFMFFDVKVPR